MLSRTAITGEGGSVAICSFYKVLVSLRFILNILEKYWRFTVCPQIRSLSLWEICFTVKCKNTTYKRTSDINHNSYSKQPNMKDVPVCKKIPNQCVSALGTKENLNILLLTVGDRYLHPEGRRMNSSMGGWSEPPKIDHAFLSPVLAEVLRRY